MVWVQNHGIWLAQKAIAQLFGVGRSVLTKHLKNIFKSRGLSEESVCANFALYCDCALPAQTLHLMRKKQRRNVGKGERK